MKQVDTEMVANVARHILGHQSDPGVKILEDEAMSYIWKEEELDLKQMEDPDIAPLVKWKANGEVRLSWGEVSTLSAVTKTYWMQWESLTLIHGLLYRRWENENGTECKYLLIAPKALRNDILRHLQCSRTAGHLAVKKTAARVYQRFYWINWRHLSKNGVESVMVVLHVRDPLANGLT